MLPLGAVIATVWANTAGGGYFRVAHALAFPVNDVGAVLAFAYLAQEVLETVPAEGMLFVRGAIPLPIVAGAGGATGAILTYRAYVFAAHEQLLAQGWPIACGIDLFASVAVARYVFARNAAVPFLLLAVITSDVAGLLLISLSGSTSVHHPFGGLLIIAAALAAVALRPRVRDAWPVLLIAGTLSWIGCYVSGIHPAIALLPIVPALRRSPRAIESFGRDQRSHRLAYHFESQFEYPVQLVALLFGFVNEGVLLRGYDTGTWAMLVASLLGRPLGMVAGVAIALALGQSQPTQLRWRDLVVVAMCASPGIAFAMFLSTAVYPDGPPLIQTKIAALLSGVGIVVAIAAARALCVGRFVSQSYVASTSGI